MAYNARWGGTIDFPPERWPAYARRWLCGDSARFYRFLRDARTGELVGEAAYRVDDAGRALASVIVHSRFRGRGYGGLAIELLCDSARANGLDALYDEIAADNPALGLFLRHGFVEIGRDDERVLVMRAL